MSVKTKTRFKNLSKMVGIGLFVILMLTNIKFVLLDDDEIASGDISLLGIEMTLLDDIFACASYDPGECPGECHGGGTGGGIGGGGVSDYSRYVQTGTRQEIVTCVVQTYILPPGIYTISYEQKTVYYNVHTCMEGGVYYECAIGGQYEEYAGGGC